ncbi:sodium:solute symporter family protein [Candidatus Methylopumilus planktonicus]|uniref:sodium:solute symporter family protein n=1 Tax=Candidatus Methylopumilus planktonicus TaxID=1581557 RepID=UPI0011240F7C|nr:sodium:solute symporter family protein [Candidatus Methylopumilus planktonicus]QDD11191.1 sodium:solute symporter [Candidatus Methylopumilus planktonicus]QDD23661.1 sodium:solute symporter [Candidatus Methylopumilus planktonicus]
MLIWFVSLYLLVTIGIGIFVSSRVKTTKDYAVAGRHLPLPIVTATVFATWFGAEAIFGVSSTFVKEGLNGVVADPFGSSLCLIIAGIFFSSKLYKLNIITLGDFYRARYNRTVEVLTTIAIVISYLGWVAAQIKALGLIFNLITHQFISEDMGMVIGILIVLTFTTFGGMLSVAILDFIQMIVVIGGLLYIAYAISQLTGGIVPVIESASINHKLDFFPKGNIWTWITFFGTWITMMLGSVPQQDVFQRVTSAKTAKVALYGSILGATIYFIFTFVPMFIAYSATLIDAEYFNGLVNTNSQHVLPMLVLNYMPLFAQVIFFGAVLSAIMSCSSATLLAPSISFAENIVKGYFPTISDKRLLKIMRITLVCFSAVVLLYALSSNLSIFGMVESAYKITLAGAFVPLVFGVFWKKANSQGALMAIIGGIGSWLFVELFIGDKALIPAQLIGLGNSIIGMIVGSLLPKIIKETNKFSNN